MGQIGSKIAVFIIVLAMVILASVLYDSAQNQGKTPEVSSEYIPYSDIVKDNQEWSQETLTFEHFALREEKYRGAAAAVDFSTEPLARAFEQIIERDVEAIGVNFAGRYAVITWSCGEDCQNSAIINVQNGSIIDYGILAAYGLAYSPDSRLLIVNPEANLPSNENADVSYVTDYYVFDEDENLTLIAKKVKGEEILNSCTLITVAARNPLTNEQKTFDTPCQVPFGWEIVARTEG